MKKVLVVDDDAMVVEFLIACLKKEGYETQEAYGGEQGYKRAVSFKPDLMVLDLMMPDMHGFDVCQTVRSDRSLNEMKVLISSAKGYEVDKKAVQRLGANGYINKPFGAEEFIKEVEGLIGKP
ncbi:MAG: response regulator [Elusimicrobiota bacterium]